MKKILALFVAALMVFGLGTAAMAANQVEVKTNSAGITMSLNACEKAGNINFIFDAGTVIQDGDWWTADLPIGVTLCRSINYAVVGVTNTFVPQTGTGGFPTIAQADGTTTNNGIWTVKDIGTDALAGGIIAGGTDFIWFRVSGAAGSSRLTIAAYDSDVAGNGYLDPANSNASSTLTVAADSEFALNLFDGGAYNGVLGGYTGVWAFNDTGIGGLAPDGTYGNAVSPADNLQITQDWDNSYCITVDPAVYVSQTVNVSINSGGVSGNNFLQFNPSNPQVAHQISAALLNLAMCKADEFGFASLAGGQGSACAFDYDTAAGYCTDVLPAVFTAATGNSVIIENTSGTFFQALDEYRVGWGISGNGAYFGGNPAGIMGYLPTNSTSCTTQVPNATILPGYKTPVIESGGNFTTFATGAGCGSIAVGQEVVYIESNKFGKAAGTGIETFNKLMLDVPVVVFDPAQLTAGDQVTLTVDFYRLPCGLIFTGTRVLAEFVATCGTAAPLSTLYYPYAVPLDGSSGFWFGFVLGNPGTAAGTATITFVEADGDIGTATVTVGALGLVVYGNPELLGLLTADAGNTGTLGDSAAHIVVNCAFAGAGGFGMTGNGADSTGYTPYGAVGTSIAWTY